MINLIGLIFFHGTLKELVELSFHSELYSHILLIPLVSFYIFFVERKTIFNRQDYSLQTGISVLGVGLLFYWLGNSHILSLNQNDNLSLMIFAALIYFEGAFIMCYGTQSFRSAKFPLLFLVFMIPIPTRILDPFVHLLLIGSTHITASIFKILGVPFYRHGFIFELPGISIEVAKECSGIRSTLALFITSVVAGHLFLRTGRRKLLLSLFVFPLTIFKNSLRIVTISLLAAYIDQIFVTNHWIHRAGGKPFFIFALFVFLPVLLLLRRSEEENVESLKYEKEGI